MDIKYLDYNNSIVNLACSVLKHYGAEIHYENLAIFDKYLKKNHKVNIFMHTLHSLILLCTNMVALLFSKAEVIEDSTIQKRVRYFSKE